MPAFFPLVIAEAVRREVVVLMDWFRDFDPAQLKMTPFGDSEGMQLIQQGRFEEVLALLEAGNIQPTRNFCGMTFTHMAIIMSASKDQIERFEACDTKAGLDSLTLRITNGEHQSHMIAANQVNLNLLTHFVAEMEEKGTPWKLKNQSNLGRTVAHDLFLPSLMKGEHDDQAYLDIVAFLLEKGVPFDQPDELGLLPIDYARIYYPSLKLDLDKIDPNLKRKLELPDRNQLKGFWGDTEIHEAVYKGNLDKLRELIQLNATALANSTKQTPLHILGCKTVSDSEKIQCMLECLLSLEAKGTGMNQEDINGFLPIHNAVIFGMVDFFERLLEVTYNGKTLGSLLSTLQDAHGRTVAHHVCMNGPASNEESLRITKMILTRCGPSVFLQPDIYGVPPFMYAYYCRKDLLPFILKGVMSSLNIQNCAEATLEAALSITEEVALNQLLDKVQHVFHHRPSLVAPFNKFLAKTEPAVAGEAAQVIGAAIPAANQAAGMCSIL